MPHRVLTSLLAAVMALGLLAATGSEAAAQEESQAEEPGRHWVALTTFEIPLHVRDDVIPYMRRYVIPSNRLNPHVHSFRVLVHNWGSHGSQIAFYREYESFEAINADCGEPCETFEKEHPEPEEGDEGYEAHERAEKLFQKYFSDHRDEIYWIPMSEAKTGGENIGPLWPDLEEEEEQ